MTDEHGLPGSEIADNYTKAIGKTIEEGFATAVKGVEDKMERKMFWRSLGLMFAVPLMSAGAVWLVISYTSEKPITWSAEHADGLNETCVLKQDTPDPDAVLFVCHLVPALAR